MLARIRDRLRPAHGLLIGGAWFFIVASVLHLFWVIGVKFDDPGGVTKLYHTVIGGISYDAVGLTYHGPGGLVLALFQLALVAAAAGATILPWRSPRAVQMRRLGHVTLVLWSLLWAANLLWLLTLDAGVDTVGQFSILVVLLGCTVYRAVRGWNVPTGSTRSESDDEEFDHPSAGTLETDIAPEEKLVLRLRDVDSSKAAPEIRHPRLRAAWRQTRAIAGRVFDQGRRLLKRVPRPHREKVREKVGGLRQEAAVGLRQVADFTARQADRLAGPDGTPKRQHSRSA